ncbi:MAG: flagellar hook-length control protein [Paenibacillus sp.]|nr:flagellar hook-length control protein [Paenibacillus sp.]
MEMMIPGMAATPVPSPIATVQTGSKGQGDSAGFQQALIQQIAGQPSGEAAVEQPISLVAAVAGLAAIASGETNAHAPALEDLMAAIDGLIDQLDESGEEKEELSEQKLGELEATLESLNALLALLGAPVVKLQPQSVRPNADDAQRIGLMEASAQIKSSLQDALLQLQATLQQGTLKQVQGQTPLALIGEQLKAIAAKLEGAAPQEKVGAMDSKANVPDWLNVLPANAKDAQTHLQRLTNQSAHPAFIQALTEQNTLIAEVAALQEGGANAADSGTPTQLPLMNADNVRDFGSLLTKSTSPSAFVLAEEFADTMEGLIVQKFDVRSLNGATEAKLILFPEHLGQVDVKISMQNGLLTAVFQADTAMAKDMLENQMAQLRAALQAQGLNVEKLEVTQSSTAAQLTNQQFGSGQQGGQPSDERQGLRDGDFVSDNAFETEIAEQAAIQGLGYGRAINETA